MNRLVRLYASNLQKAEAITAAGDDLRKLSFTTASQLADENLGLGNETWVYLAGLEEDNDPKPFYRAVRRFYLASIRKMLKLGIQLRDLGIINPDKVTTYSFETIKSLAKRFPQLDLAGSESIDGLSLWTS